MPVNFLTKEQQESYGKYNVDPSEAQLARYFYLDDTDMNLINQHRGEHNRLGFALQLGTVRFLGTFLVNPTEVPTVVLDYLAKQLDVTNKECILHYGEGETHWDHAAEIKRFYGYHDFCDPLEYFSLVRWLYTRAWVSNERPSVLFDLATARLVERKVLLPGVTVLARLISRVRDRVADRLWQTLADKVDLEQRSKLEALLVVPEGRHLSGLDRLSRPPTRISGPALVSALNRLNEIRTISVGELSLASIPQSRTKALARHAAAVRTQAIARMTDERRIATLLAFAREFEIRAMDDALDLLDVLMTDTMREAENTGKTERIRTLRDLDAAALCLVAGMKIILDETYDDAEIRKVIFARIPKEQLSAAATTVEELARPPNDNYYPELISKYLRVRRFLPTLLQTVTFASTSAAQPILTALEFLTSIEGQRRPNMEMALLEIVPPSWQRQVLSRDGEIDRRAYTLCVLEQLVDSLRRRDVFVEKSDRWCDPRSKLLSGKDWQVARPKILKALGRSSDAKEEIGALVSELDTALRRTAENFPANAAVRIEPKNGRDTLTVTGLDKLEESPSLIALREQVKVLLPRVELPELLLEIHARTGFAHEFTHISFANARVEDLPISICAALIAEACNIGIEPLIHSDNPALTRGRLEWVQQNYIRAETLIRANARLVEEQTYIPLAQTWGGGEVASADGLRFVVPVRTINAGPNPKYFHLGRGVTYYNFTSDQFTGFHSIVIPGTLRDSLYILEGLLEQETSLNPVEVMADTAGVSDVVFGLFWLLGYQFSPRLADIGESRFWRIDKEAYYGTLDGLARNRINIRIIERYWDDMLRVAGSLKSGTIRASELLRSLLKSKRPSTLARAIGELGKIPKTLYLLTYVDDEAYRRRILVQLNRHEDRHKLGKATFHGQRGEIRKRYREGQEDQLSALGLVVNAIVLWNTLYMDLALNHLRTEGFEVKEEDVQRIWPLSYNHINFLGRYFFTLPENIAKGQLRDLKNPLENEL
jgi:TnpA family transposase